MASGPAHDNPDVPQRHTPLADERADRGARDAEVEAENEGPVDGDVERCPHGRDDERDARVLKAAHETESRLDHEHRREACGGDPQVCRCFVRDLRSGPEEADHDIRAEAQHERAREPNEGGEPRGVDALREGFREITRAHGASNRRRCGIREEDREAHDCGEDRRSDREAGEGSCGHVPHKGRVHENKERLGHERAEGGNRKCKDCARIGSGLRRIGGGRRTHASMLRCASACTRAPGAPNVTRKSQPRFDERCFVR